jgi:hypothetical protein
MKYIGAGIALLSVFSISAGQNPQAIPQQQFPLPQYPSYPGCPPVQYPWPYFMSPIPTPAPTSSQAFYFNTQSSAGSEAKPVTQLAPTTTQTQIQPVVQSSTLQDRLQPFYATVIAFMHKHWIGCGAIAVGALYGWLVTYILYMRHRIQHTHLWSSWQRHQTMEQLMLQPHEILKTALVKDIAAQYINPDNPTDQVWPLTEFMSACKREEQELRRYLSIAKIVKKTGLYRILPSLADEYAQQALTKLLFVYHLFTAWSADITWQQYKKGINL